MGLQVVHELMEIVGESPCASKYLARFLSCWNNTIMGRLKELGYKNMWLTWIHHNMSPNHGRERLQFEKLLPHVSTAVCLLILFNPTNRCGFCAATTGKSGLSWNPMTPCRGQEWSGTAWSILWNSSGVLHNRKRQLLTLITTNWLRPLTNIVPTCIGQRKKRTFTHARQRS